MVSVQQQLAAFRQDMGRDGAMQRTECAAVISGAVQAAQQLVDSTLQVLTHSLNNRPRALFKMLSSHISCPKIWDSSVQVPGNLRFCHLGRAICNGRTHSVSPMCMY